MNRQRKPLSESINNKINMVRNVFNKKRFEDLQDEMFRSRVKQSLRGISEESEEVQLLVESKRMTDYVNTLNWMTNNGNQTRQSKKMENRN
jgi:hypothetical protein